MIKNNNNERDTRHFQPTFVQNVSLACVQVGAPRQLPSTRPSEPTTFARGLEKRAQMNIQHAIHTQSNPPRFIVPSSTIKEINKVEKTRKRRRPGIWHHRMIMIAAVRVFSLGLGPSA